MQMGRVGRYSLTGFPSDHVLGNLRVACLAPGQLTVWGEPVKLQGSISLARPEQKAPFWFIPAE
jgi:hypothetical protein